MPKKDLSKLVAKQKLVVNKQGHAYNQTVWVDANKEIAEPKYNKKRKDVAEVNVRKNTGTVRLDHPTLKRGDKVVLEHKGETITGEFRHIAITDRYPKGLAVVQTPNGLVQRPLHLITPMSMPTGITTNEAFARKHDSDAFSLGDRVTFTLRERDPDGIPYGREVNGHIVRFKEKDSKGQLIHIKLDDGVTKERYLHNVTRYDQKLSNPLPEGQVAALNKAMLRIPERNKEDFALIAVLQGHKGSEAKIEGLKSTIEIRNMKMVTFLKVLRREIPFEDLHEDPGSYNGNEEDSDAIKPEFGKHKWVMPAKKEEKLEVDPDVAALAAKQEKLTELEDNVNRSVRNMKLYAVPSSYGEEMQLYKSKKAFIRNMNSMIEFKREHEMDLSEGEIAFVENAPIEPERPIEPEPEPEPDKKTSTPIVPTITTMGDQVKLKQKEATVDKQREDILAQIERIKTMGLTEKTEGSLLAKYQEKLDKLNKPVTLAKKRKTDSESIFSDIAKIGLGHDPKVYKINQRIMDGNFTLEEKSDFARRFAAAIKQGKALRSGDSQEARIALVTHTKPAAVKLEELDEEFEKAIIHPSIINHLRSNKTIQSGDIVMMSYTLFKALDTDINYQSYCRLASNKLGSNQLRIVVIDMSKAIDPTEGGKLIPVHIIDKNGHHTVRYHSKLDILQMKASKDKDEIDHQHVDEVKVGDRFTHKKNGEGFITKIKGHDGKGHELAIEYHSGKKGTAYIHNIDMHNPGNKFKDGKTKFAYTPEQILDGVFNSEECSDARDCLSAAKQIWIRADESVRNIMEFPSVRKRFMALGNKFDKFQKEDPIEFVDFDRDYLEVDSLQTAWEKLRRVYKEKSPILDNSASVKEVRDNRIQHLNKLKEGLPKSELGIITLKGYDSHFAMFRASNTKTDDLVFEHDLLKSQLQDHPSDSILLDRMEGNKRRLKNARRDETHYYKKLESFMSRRGVKRDEEIINVPTLEERKKSFTYKSSPNTDTRLHEGALEILPDVFFDNLPYNVKSVLRGTEAIKSLKTLRLQENGAYYTAAGDAIVISPTVWTGEPLGTSHEYFHHFHSSTKRVTTSNVDPEFANVLKIMKTEFLSKSTEFTQMYRRGELIFHYNTLKGGGDKVQFSNYLDSIEGVTDCEYGAGHGQYFIRNKAKNIAAMECFVHMGQMYFEGNTYFEKNLPETTKAANAYFHKIFGND